METIREFEELVILKEQERQLTEDIKVAQQRAIDKIKELKITKTGKIAEFNGAKVTYKLVTVKPKVTEEIKQMQERLDFLRNSMKVTYRTLIENKTKQIENLNEEIQQLLSDPETIELEQKIEKSYASLVGKKEPQIAVTLPKFDDCEF